MDSTASGEEENRNCDLNTWRGKALSTTDLDHDAIDQGAEQAYRLVGLSAALGRVSEESQQR
eukprot:2632540-Rhodomonas_salina.1